jgi:hypothetical protein
MYTFRDYLADLNKLTTIRQQLTELAAETDSLPVNSIELPPLIRALNEVVDRISAFEQTPPS